jgi:hypothetical protein
MNEPKEFPAVSAKLVQELDRIFPAACADLADSDRMVWFKVGRRDVVAFLKEKLRQQEEKMRMPNVST